MNADVGCSREGGDVIADVCQHSGDAQEEGGMETTVPNTPTLQSEQEVEKHKFTHQPYRSWCKHCAMGKANDVAHKQIDGEGAHPAIAMVYVSTGDEKSTALVLTFCDSKEEYRAAMASMWKGSSGQILGRAVDWISNLGCSKAILKADQEFAITGLQRDSKRIYVEEMTGLTKSMGSINANVVPENPPVGGSQASGAVESTIKQIQGPNRTLRLALESNNTWKLQFDDPVWFWLIECVAGTFNRFRVGESCVIPFKRVAGMDSRQPLAAFVGKVIFHLSKQMAKKLDKSATRWEEYIFICFNLGSNGYFVGTRGELSNHILLRYCLVRGVGTMCFWRVCKGNLVNPFRDECRQ